MTNKDQSRYPYDISEDGTLTTEKQNVEVVDVDKLAALDEFEQMLSFIALSHSYWGTCDKDFISDFAVNTIRAALSQDVNAELLEALKEAEWSKGGFCPLCGGSIHSSIGGEIFKKHKDECKIGKAIARAEQKGGV